MALHLCFTAGTQVSLLTPLEFVILEARNAKRTNRCSGWHPGNAAVSRCHWKSKRTIRMWNAMDRMNPSTVENQLLTCFLIDHSYRGLDLQSCRWYHVVVRQLFRHEAGKKRNHSLRLSSDLYRCPAASLVVFGSSAHRWENRHRIGHWLYCQCSAHIHGRDVPGSKGARARSLIPACPAHHRRCSGILDRSRLCARS